MSLNVSLPSETGNLLHRKNQTTRLRAATPLQRINAECTHAHTHIQERRCSLCVRTACLRVYVYSLPRLESVKSDSRRRIESRARAGLRRSSSCTHNFSLCTVIYIYTYAEPALPRRECTYIYTHAREFWTKAGLAVLQKSLGGRARVGPFLSVIYVMETGVNFTLRPRLSGRRRRPASIDEKYTLRCARVMRVEMEYEGRGDFVQLAVV